MVEAGLLLVVLAAVCAVAAAVGGNVHLPGGVKFPELSRSVRIVLAGPVVVIGSAGILLAIVGLLPLEAPVYALSNSPVPCQAQQSFVVTP
jgi:hypothetical protein